MRLIPSLRGSLITLLVAVGITLAGCTTAAPGPTATSVNPTAQPTTVSNNGGTSMVNQYSAPPAMQIDPQKTYTATLHTTKGEITIELFPGEAPKTVNNFVFLAREGFYDNVKFHRIIRGFMVQTGDPTGTGAGGPGYRFEDERVTRDYDRGIVAMANAGPNTNGSQFFIMHANNALPKNYTIFGQVTDQQSLATLDAIANTPVRANSRGELSMPTEDVLITSVDITEE